MLTPRGARGPCASLRLRLECRLRRLRYSTCLVQGGMAIIRNPCLNCCRLTLDVIRPQLAVLNSDEVARQTLPNPSKPQPSGPSRQGTGRTQRSSGSTGPPAGPAANRALWPQLASEAPAPKKLRPKSWLGRSQPDRPRTTLARRGCQPG